MWAQNIFLNYFIVSDAIADLINGNYFKTTAFFFFFLIIHINITGLKRGPLTSFKYNVCDSTLVIGLCCVSDELNQYPIITYNRCIGKFIVL